MRQILASKFLGNGLYALSACFAIVFATVYVPGEFARRDMKRDAYVYYVAAHRAAQGMPVYERVDQAPDEHPAMNYLYAPWTLPILKPFAALPWVGFMRMMLALNLMALCSLSVVLAALSGKLTLRRCLIYLMLICLWPGAVVAVFLGQVDPLLWLAAGLGVLFYRSPLGWLLAAAIKPFYVFPLLAGKFSWKQFLLPCAAIGCLAIAGGWLLGWEVYLFWMKYVLPPLSQGNFHAYNWSIPFAAVRLVVAAGWLPYSGGTFPGYVQTFLSICSLGAPLVAWLTTRRLPEQTRMAIIVLAAAWCAPICWNGYLVCGAPLLALMWRRWTTANGVVA